jgi:eukaryotic-like serine/threonine-protein kinase
MVPDVISLSPAVGSPAPDFRLETITSDGYSSWRSLKDYQSRWLALLFYPRDRSFVCPTELTAFSARVEELFHRDCEILATSIDSLADHRAWFELPLDQGGVGALRFPLASDPTGEVARRYGIWNAQVGLPNRGLFLIDPQGVLQYAVVHSLSVGRSVDEFLRVLDALKTGGICPASWTRADGTLDVENMLRSGRVLGHYRIEKELGRGSFASVFSARDLRLERYVALKILRRTRSTPDRDILAEARSAASINHPYVCAVHAVDEIDGLPVIVMELLEGETLAKLIPNRIPLDQCLDFAAMLAEGLDAAHQQDIVHGDLKPANVLVVHGNRPVIVDFGLAHTRKQDRHYNVTSLLPGSLEPGTVTESLSATTEFSPKEPILALGSSIPAHLEGTPAYMAPEQALDRPSLPASDVFTLGLVCYEMLTGCRALTGNTLEDVLGQVQNPLFHEQLKMEFDPRIAGILRKLLRHDPAERPTAAAARRMFSRLRHDFPTSNVRR